MSWDSLDAPSLVAILGHARDAVLVASGWHGPMVAANPAASALLGLDAELLTGQNLTTFLDDSDPRWAVLVDQATATGTAHGPGRVVVGEGRTAEVTATLARIEADLVCLVFVDTAPDAEIVRLLRAQASVDELTGLYNRRGFTQVAVEELRRPYCRPEDYELLYLDVDFFKMINDSYGHTAGDAVLIAVAEVLRAQARPSDVVARYGGDEFVVLHRLTTDHCPDLAARLHAALAEITVGDHLSVSASIGRHRASRGETIRDLVAKADADMYEAKRRRVR